VGQLLQEELTEATVNDEGHQRGRAADGRPPVAEAEGISKSFASTRALDSVSLTVEAGECHALVGRNGAGKSTLVAILTGMTRSDEGSVRLCDEPAPGIGDRAGWQERVACVYQRSMLVPTLTVAENIFLNRSDSPLVSWRYMRDGARRVLGEWGFELDVDALAGSLSVEQKQIVEIVRALSSGARFLILDEPTASLEASAAERLFGHVRRLKESGVGILFISHHLEEVYEICDRATVLRDGRQIVTERVGSLDQAALVHAMVGDVVAEVSTSGTGARGASAEPCLNVRGLVVGSAASSAAGSVDDLSLDVCPYECVGLFGLRGCGATAVADAVVGLISPDAGTIGVGGTPLRPGRVDDAVAAGVAYVPEDRHARGFVSVLGVDENITLPILRRLTRYGVVSRSRRSAAAARLRSRLQIVSSGGGQPVGELSGGNQQKVVVGRALGLEPKLLVVVGPTTGVDVASKAALLGVIEEARSEGAAVLLVSDDLDELRICTRLLVMVRGSVVREFREQPWDRHELIAAAEGLAA
jgi:simple sugar transport system ATP-binding protein